MTLLQGDARTHEHTLRRLTTMAMPHCRSFKVVVEGNASQRLTTSSLAVSSWKQTVKQAELRRIEHKIIFYGLIRARIIIIIINGILLSSLDSSIRDN